MIDAPQRNDRISTRNFNRLKQKLRFSNSTDKNLSVYITSAFSQVLYILQANNILRYSQKSAYCIGNEAAWNFSIAFSIASRKILPISLAECNLSLQVTRAFFFHGWHELTRYTTSLLLFHS